MPWSQIADEMEAQSSAKEVHEAANFIRRQGFSDLPVRMVVEVQVRALTFEFECSLGS